MTARHLRILVVEDDQDARDLMADVLALTGRHSIVVARSGEEGLAHLRTEQAFDMVVTDIGLPGVSGLEMLDEAKRDGLLGGAEVVVCSASTWLRREVLARGARCLDKPVDPEKICEAVLAHESFDPEPG